MISLRKFKGEKGILKAFQREFKIEPYGVEV
jgi:hypothetical protein